MSRLNPGVRGPNAPSSSPEFKRASTVRPLISTMRSPRARLASCAGLPAITSVTRSVAGCQERRREAEADELALGEERLGRGARGDVAERFVERPVTYRREIFGWRRERDRIDVGYVAIPEIDIGHHVAHVEVLRGDVARRRRSLGRCLVVGRTGGERNDEDGRQAAREGHGTTIAGPARVAGWSRAATGRRALAAGLKRVQERARLDCSRRARED